VVRCEQIIRRFRPRGGEVNALQEVDLQVRQSEFLAIRGPSGSGKTTLLLTIGGMLRPTSGRVTVAGRDVYAMSERDRARFRADNIGFVFQMFHLVPYLSVVENVRLAAGAAAKRADHSQAIELLERLGLSERRHHTPAELSSGESQRAAIARALLNRPRVILADEPTGNLDPDNAAEVFQALASFHHEGGTVIVATHGTLADKHADRIIHLRKGRIDESTPNAQLTPAP